MSKGNIFKVIIEEYDNVIVGKMLLELLRYMQSKNMITDKNQEKWKQCVSIGNRLIGKIKKESMQVVKPINAAIDYDYWINELKILSDYGDSPQARGYAFEKLLKNMFEAFELNPRGSFKIVDEQIDGSFVLYRDIYLLEAKWTNKKIDKGELVIFNEKVNSKSGFTRGVFISYAGYEQIALQTFSQGRTINVLLIT